MFTMIQVVNMESKRKFRPDPNLKLMDQVRQVMRYHHYAYRTEQTYHDWIIRYIKHFNCRRHPGDMGKTEIEAFLSHLAMKGKVSAATQRQALNAIIFLYDKVLEKENQHGTSGWHEYGRKEVECEEFILCSQTREDRGETDSPV